MRRNPTRFFARVSKPLLDILHKETSFQLKRSAAAATLHRRAFAAAAAAAAAASPPHDVAATAAGAPSAYFYSSHPQQRFIADVAYDNGLRTLTVHSEHRSSSCTVPYEWLLDHDHNNLDHLQQRKCILHPDVLGAFDIDTVHATVLPTSGELLLDITWRAQRPVPPVPRNDISYPPLMPSRSAVRVSPSVLATGPCTVGTAAFLPAYQSASLHFYSRISTPREPWTVQSLHDGKPRGSLDPPMSVLVPHVNTRDLSHKGDLLRTIERFGFAVVVDPSLSQRGGRTTEETVARRKEAAEAIILNTFKVLRNSHYGLMSTWSASDAWKSVKIVDPAGAAATAAASSSTGNHQTTRKSAASAAKKKGPAAVRTAPSKKKIPKATPLPPASDAVIAPDGDATHQDGAYAASLLDLHTDGTYFVECPKLQAFGCIFYDKALTVGGESTIADGMTVAGELAEKHPQLFRLLCTVPVGGRYEKEGKVYEAYRPVITLRPTTSNITRSNVAEHVERISFNNSDRCPMLLGAQSSIWSAAELRMFYQAYYKFHELLHSPEFAFRFLLRPGQLLFFDNHRVLHGRLKFAGPRVMCGAYVGSDEYYSSLKADGGAAAPPPPQ